MIVDSDNIAKFFAHLDDYKENMERIRESSAQRLAIAEGLPVGLTHDSNLYMDEAGNVWCSGTRNGKGALIRVERSGGEFSEYKPTKDFLADDATRVLDGGSIAELGGKRFPKRSQSCLAEHWGWYSAPGRNSTAYYSKLNLEDADRSIKWIDLLIGQKPEIEHWVRENACSDPYQIQDEFMRTFAPGFVWYGDGGPRLNDTSGVRCSLHLALGGQGFAH